MQKTTKVLGVISLTFSFFLIWIFIQYLVDSSSADAGWIDLGFYLISLVFLILAVILSIPFLVLLIKLKFKQMKFYAYAHLSFIVLSVLSFVISIT